MPTSRRREKHVALYTKDKELFAQRMAYTRNGLTWWGTPCCYCGEPATSEDHVFPIAALTKLGFAMANRIPLDILRIVPACLECNMLAGDTVFFTFEEKCLYVKDRIAHRYGPAVEAPTWDQEELAELGGRLHDYVADSQRIRETVFARLRF